MRMEKTDLTDELAPEIREICEGFNQLYERASLAEQIVWHRTRAVRTCRNNRKILRLPGDPALQGYAGSALRRAQIRLLRIRIWRATGVYPAEG
ncbi:hypothetical protein FV232_27490 [Methylobacterium sp. WL30]|uniref:hypothetical protein n=1 Tax=unclassified Methylobacterium TaxID=2615210 RepID=UPI0011CBC98C|nr:MULTISPECIES: hypothetical protein [unclassified Methylobacterium]TXM91479.1 hypothetical protein FV223_15065 [Methylobacterium sp. WL116]TXN34539.1 hypothetical protein FV225_16285 [Methylobacterium sp. WL93]TXN44179.1 hypothetical protein FV227_27040 [Methylobacterium sp. WL119]TXN61159.1 hypothetical protein FV232_27490 [Methylobacterium sp. WL30]